MSKTTRTEKKPIEQYDHKGKERCNNPPVGLVTPETDRDGGKKTYAYDPHLDPALVWAGKAEHTSFEKALTKRIRTRMTRIGRIFTDILNPCVSVSSVLSVFLHTKMIERISAFICVHLRLISLTETSRIINVEVQQW